MGLTLFPLGDYCALLDKLGLLAAPLPEGLELGRTVELLSYNSRVPCFSVRGPTSSRSTWRTPSAGGPLPTSAKPPSPG